MEPSEDCRSLDCGLRAIPITRHIGTEKHRFTATERLVSGFAVDSTPRHCLPPAIAWHSHSSRARARARRPGFDGGSVRLAARVVRLSPGQKPTITHLDFVVKYFASFFLSRRCIDRH